MVDAPRPLAPAVQTESERALSTLLANLPGVAYRCLNRPRWPMEFLSQGCLELTGYPPETFVMNAEMEYGDIIHAEDRKRIWGEVQLAIDTDRPFTLEYRIRTADGRQRRVWERGRAVRDVAGVLVSLEGFIWDVTERVELEARVLEAQRLEVMGQLAGGVVHDINNMLMVIRSFLDMAAAGHHGNSSKDWVGPAVHAVERGAALTRQLLTIARQEPHERREVELNGLLEGFVAMIGPLLGKLVTVDLHPADGPIRVYADPTQLEQVLMNLCINARDAMPDGGRLTLRCRALPADDQAVIEVADTGAGIDPGIQRDVFSPFYTTKPAGQGTGLGLFTVARIVQQHHGRVALHSAPGQGSRFEVFLPLHQR